MPLSEQEQRLLDEMERHLMRNDADVVSAPRDGRTPELPQHRVRHGPRAARARRAHRRRRHRTRGRRIIVGVIGFLVMLGGVILAVTPTRGIRPQSRRSAASPRTSREPSSSFMDRMNDRWDKRQGER